MLVGILQGIQTFLEREWTSKNYNIITRALPLKQQIIFLGALNK
jgi:hypothetical protein